MFAGRGEKKRRHKSRFQPRNRDASNDQKSNSDTIKRRAFCFRRAVMLKASALTPVSSPGHGEPATGCVAETTDTSSPWFWRPEVRAPRVSSVGSCLGTATRHVLARKRFLVSPPVLTGTLGAALVTPLTPVSFCKVLCPNAVSLGLGLQRVNTGAGNSVHSAVCWGVCSQAPRDRVGRDSW